MTIMPSGGGGEAIIPLSNDGTWFVKLYGPQATIKAAEKEFVTMIQGVKYTP